MIFKLMTVVNFLSLFFIPETADREQLAQLQILNKAQHRQIEDLERKLEDLRRNMRYVEHQHAIVKGKRNNAPPSKKNRHLAFL